MIGVKQTGIEWWGYGPRRCQPAYEHAFLHRWLGMTPPPPFALSRSLRIGIAPMTSMIQNDVITEIDGSRELATALLSLPSSKASGIKRTP